MHEQGRTLKAEIIRTADMLEEMQKEQDIYYLVVFLKDIQYVQDERRYNLLLEELYDRYKNKLGKEKIT